MPSPLLTDTQSGAVGFPPGTEPAAAKTTTNSRLIAVVFSDRLCVSMMVKVLPDTNLMRS
jgi:hypothetical protein